MAFNLDYTDCIIARISQNPLIINLHPENQRRIARLFARLVNLGVKVFITTHSFPIGFVLDLFHLLKKGKVIKAVQQTERRVQVLLASYGAAGIAAHLFIEQIKFDLASVDLDTEIVSEPYPHPDEMFSISIDPSFKNTLVRAFEYVSQALLREGKKEIPVFRWWLKPASGEREIEAIEGNSLYGAFVVGMLCSARHENVSPKVAISCDGSQYGRMLPIVDDLGCQAAERQGWRLVVAKETENAWEPETIEKAIRYFTSEKEFEVMDYLDLVHDRWKKWQRGDKTQLLAQGIQISDESALSLKEKPFDLKKVNIPIFISSPRLAKTITEKKCSFEDAIYATLKKEYLIDGRAVSDDFLALVKEKFLSGQCYLLLDDFYDVEAVLKDELDIFVLNYKKCQICKPPKKPIPPINIIFKLLSLLKNPISSRNRIFKLSFFLIMIIILPIVIALYYIGKGGGVDDNNPWYDKAKMESDNQFALGYLNMGLKEYPKHVDSLALKIKLLLLIGGRDKRGEAEKVAENIKKMGISRELDDWVDCLRENFFKSSDRLVMTTETEIESLCPFSR